MNKLPIYSKEPCSEDFRLNFSKAGTHASVDCTACGRIHFSEDNGLAEYEKNEYRSLVSKNKRNPDKYIMHDANDGLSFSNIFGKQVVFSCKCNYARFVEDGLTDHFNSILSYFDAITEEDLKEATQEREAVKALVKKNKKKS